MSETISLADSAARPRWLGALANAETRAWAVSLLAVATGWMIAHPYLGVYHDAQLYALQALNWLDPERFGSDLYFLYGSQDDYTVFTPLFAPIVGLAGLGFAAKLVTALGQALWLTAAILFARRLLIDRLTVTVALLLVVCLPAFHSGLNVLMYGEGFATPRLFSEAATLWAFWLLAGERRFPALLIMLAACALHPLYGGVGLGAVLLYLAIGDWRWWLVIAAAPIGTGLLAVAGIGPFDRLFVTIDGAWLQLVEQRNPMVFSFSWTVRDWIGTGLSAGAVGALAWVSTGNIRRFSIAILLAAVGGMIVTIVGADILRNAFLTQVQLFRANWMLEVFGHLALGVLLVRLWHRRDNALALTALLVAGWLSAWLLPVALSVMAAAALILIAIQVRYGFKPCGGTINVVCLSIAFIVVFMTGAGRVIFVIDMVDAFVEQRFAWHHAFKHLWLSETILLASLLFVGFGIWRERRGMAGLCVALAVAIVVSGTWDRRSAFSREVEAGELTAELNEHIEPDATIIWETSAYVPWLGLRRPAYLSWQASAGAVFSREFSAEFIARGQQLAPIETNILDQFLTFIDREGPPEQIDRAALVEACGAASALDYMFLQRRVEGAYIDRYILRGGPEGLGPGHRPVSYAIYLYDCAQLRAGTRS